MLRTRLPLVCALAIVACALPVRAERPIVDLHRLDADFQLFAADSNVPWKAAAVRLDTYSSAPVAFSVYSVDPADVLTAGSNSAPRAIVTSGRRPLLSFTFTPPGGYQFQSNVVYLALGAREGFFVVEARRGNVGEQVWVNRSRVGLISKETPSGLLLYGADLGTGIPLTHMRVQLVVNRNFVSLVTDAQGVVRWNRSPLPVFALAQWGNSYAFLSFLPQPPLPAAIVGVRTDSAVVHAGGALRVAGFARTRSRTILRPSSGDAVVSLRFGATTIAQKQVRLDAAGAFVTFFDVPASAPAGEYAVLAQAGGGVGGASVEVDANGAGLSLDVHSACNFPCDYRANVPLLVHASRGGVSVRVVVVRSPHIYLGEGPQSASWAPALWLDTTVVTDDGGNATVEVPRPNDDLSSTYGVRAESNGATANTRVIVPTAQAAIRVLADRSEQSLGAPVGFDVYADSIDGTPLSGAVVTVDLAHGTSGARQQLTLDGNGHARGSFSSPELGTNFLFASIDRGGRATDATQVRIDPQAAQAPTGGSSANVSLNLDRKVYRSDDPIVLSGEARGSEGDALITFESALGVQLALARVSGGRVVARLHAVNAAGELQVGAAFVRDGTIAWETIPLALTAPGRPGFAELSLPATLNTGGSAMVAFDRQAGPGTFVVRISRGTPSGSAVFASAPALLAIGVSTTQNSASETATWHPWVNSTGEHATALGFVRRTQPPPELSLPEAETDDVSWSVARADSRGISVPLPASAGRYDLSVLGLSDDGSVTAGSSIVVLH